MSAIFSFGAAWVAGVTAGVSGVVALASSVFVVAGGVHATQSPTGKLYFFQKL